jgi:AraC family transcriptional regulator of arabinose operon
VKDPDYCNKLVKLIFTERVLNNSEHSFKELTIEYLMMVLINKLKESVESTHTSQHYRKLLQLRNMISNNATENWTVEKMSNFLHISPGYLQSLYKSYFGISCMDDVIRSRIRKAKEYLMLGQYSVSDVAHLCGYNGVEHFCRQFKKITGCTPSDYRLNAVKPEKQKR